MLLLESQVNGLRAVLEESSFEQAQFVLDYPSETAACLTFVEHPKEGFFCIGGGTGPLYSNSYRPGEGRPQDEAQVQWQGVLSYVAEWLKYLSRELAAKERGGPAIVTPDWALEELPGYKPLISEIGRLQEDERRLRRMAGLLFETGEPLTRIVRDAIRALGFTAELTTAGATYDVKVDVKDGGLLIEVTGIEGQVGKGSKKITQVLDARRQAGQNDRVCVAVNAYRTQTLTDRATLPVLTPEAASLLTDLKAVVFTTSDLFRLWTYSRSKPDTARAVFESLRTAPSGYFSFKV